MNALELTEGDKIEEIATGKIFTVVEVVVPAAPPIGPDGLAEFPGVESVRIRAEGEPVIDVPAADFEDTGNGTGRYRIAKEN